MQDPWRTSFPVNLQLFPQLPFVSLSCQHCSCSYTTSSFGLSLLSRYLLLVFRYGTSVSPRSGSSSWVVISSSSLRKYRKSWTTWFHSYFQSRTCRQSRITFGSRSSVLLNRNVFKSPYICCYHSGSSRYCLYCIKSPPYYCSRLEVLRRQWKPVFHQGWALQYVSDNLASANVM